MSAAIDGGLLPLPPKHEDVTAAVSRTLPPCVSVDRELSVSQLLPLGDESVRPMGR